MTAPIVYADTRNPMFLPVDRVDPPYLSDGDRRTRKGWPVPTGQLWERIAEGQS